MKVFISSTYVDLVAHRRAVAHSLERLGLQLWRMEAAGAQPHAPTRACLEAVAESDLFVGIYAHRYGDVPAGATASITEAEFEHAHTLRRPPFCYFLDEGYPWPPEFVDPEPQQSKLEAFKARLSTLVVRDLFTTPDVLAARVASSVGRFLIADPRRHGARTAADYARLTLADIAAAAFVDVMRLVCTAASPEARSANTGRHAEFIDIADQHFSEFRTQVTRLSADAEYETMQLAEGVERGIAYCLTRLRRAPQLDRPWGEFARLLRDLAERVNALALSVAGPYLASRRDEISGALAQLHDESAQHDAPANIQGSPLAFLRVRHATQNAVLAALRQRGGFSIATVRDDVDRRVAVPYFLVDLTLLREAVVDG